MRRLPAFALIGCVALAGCSGDDVVSVSGTLTYKGQPVTNAFINFVPEKGRPSIGETDKDGKFTLTYDPQRKGAERGKHKVFVQYNAVADAGKPGAVPGMAPKLAPEWAEFFRKYNNDNSKVQVEIKESTSDLKLAWD
jgi:hypothetical protein